MPNNALQGRILVIDSSAEILKSMTTLFRPFGLDLRCAFADDKSVEFAHEFMPDAIYLGVEHEDANGMKLAGHLCEAFKSKRTMLAAMTNKGAKSHLANLYTLGFDYVLPRPPTMAQLVENFT